MSVATKLSIGLLILASLLSLGLVARVATATAAVRRAILDTAKAASPFDYTVFDFSVLRLKLGEVVAFVTAEHLLVGLAIWLLLKRRA